jgi:fibronectin type 3 domain-containing protein
VIAFGRECVVPVSVAAAKPDTPKATTTNEISGVNVTWNKVEGATKYNVYRRQGGYSTWTLVGTTTGNTLLDKNVKSGVYYCYSVRAYNANGAYSDYVSANTSTRKFMDTPKLTTIYNHVNGLAIKWNSVAGITNGYRVYRRGAGSTYWTYLGTTKNLYWIDNGVKNANGGYYRYTVIADGGYHSKFDTTGLYLKRLANPALLGATSSTAGITVKWSAIKGTTGYYVYRKTATSTWIRIAAVGGANNTTFLDKTAKKGTTYTYTVRAVCGNVTSYFNSGISCKDKY